jgi:hypothetical protein
MRLVTSMLFLLLPVCAQPPQDAPRKQGDPPAPANLKILKADDLRPTMRVFARSLGVHCDFCHVEGNFASDENPKKTTARLMITLAHEINGRFPDGKVHVTCYTCHRGNAKPETEAPAAPE